MEAELTGDEKRFESNHSDFANVPTGYNSSTDKINDEARKVTRRKKFTSRKSSSGADTSCSDNSDTESKRQDLLITKEHDWNRSASSRSRAKFRTGLSVTTDPLRVRPLSISSDCKEEEAGQMSRAKSMLDEMSPFKPNEANLKTLSVEHRMANMSQMSISSQLSKNNSVRHRSSDAPHNPHSTTPTPRESIVFNRGEEKPFARIFLQQSKSLVEQTPTSLNGDARRSSSSSSSDTSAKTMNQNGKQRHLSNEALIQAKLEELGKNSVRNNESYNRAIDSFERANQFLTEIEKKLDAVVSDESADRLVNNESSFETNKDDKKLLGSDENEPKIDRPVKTDEARTVESTERSFKCVNRKKNGALLKNATLKSEAKTGGESLSAHRPCTRCCLIL